MSFYKKNSLIFQMSNMSWSKILIMSLMMNMYMMKKKSNNFKLKSKKIHKMKIMM